MHTEYAQFLILNKNKLAIDSSIISYHLYSVIQTESDETILSYGRLEKNSVSPSIKKLIEKTKEAVQINPKALAYHLLLNNPEYILVSGYEKKLAIEALIQEFIALASKEGEQQSSKELLQDTMKFASAINNEVEMRHELVDKVQVEYQNTEFDDSNSHEILLGNDHVI